MEEIFQQGRAIRKSFCFFTIPNNSFLIYQNIYYKYLEWTVTKFKEPHVKKQHYLSWDGVTKKTLAEHCLFTTKTNIH